jgi:hypothetical protein
MKKVFASLIYLMISGLVTATAFPQTDGQIQSA